VFFFVIFNNHWFTFINKLVVFTFVEVLLQHEKNYLLGVRNLNDVKQKTSVRREKPERCKTKEKNKLSRPTNGGFFYV